MKFLVNRKLTHEPRFSQPLQLLQITAAAAEAGAGEFEIAKAGVVSAGDKALIHAGAGAMAGGINAGITGGNVGIGMAMGGVSAGTSKFLGSECNLYNNLDTVEGFTKGFVTSMAVGGVAGGATATFNGGQFTYGFKKGAEMAGYGFVFNAAGDITCNVVKGYIRDAIIETTAFGYGALATYMTGSANAGVGTYWAVKANFALQLDGSIPTPPQLRNWPLVIDWINPPELNNVNEMQLMQFYGNN